MLLAQASWKPAERDLARCIASCSFLWCLPQKPLLADGWAGACVGIGQGGILSMNIRHVCTYVCYEIDDHLLRLD